MKFSDTRAQIDVCLDCFHGIEYVADGDDFLGFAPGTLDGYRMAMRDNGIDPFACIRSTFRLSDGTFENVPSETFSSKPCEGCGSTLAGERMMYDYLPDADEGEDLGWTGL